jgi:predicted transposase YdaD
MVKRWDETMKKLIYTSPQQVLDWLKTGSTFLHFEPTELFKTREEEEPLRADCYMAIEQDGEQGVVHVEIQSGPDARMDERLLGYNFQFTQNDPLHRPVHSAVIYLRPVSNPPQPPLVRTFPGGRRTIQFDYDSIELAELEAQAFLDQGLPGLLPLLPLTKGGTTHETVLTMFEQMQEDATHPDLMAVGAIFASLAYGLNNTAEQSWLRKVIEDMYDIIQQTPLYQSWTREALAEGLERGLKEGKQQGLEEGLKEGERKGLEAMRQTLVNIVRARFPRLVSLARMRAALIDNFEALDDLILQMSTVSKAQEARRFLLGEEDEK